MSNETSKLDMFKGNVELVTDMLAVVGGKKNANFKSIKLTLRSLPSLPKGSELNWLPDGETWVSRIDQLTKAFSQESKDAAIVFGQVVNSLIGTINAKVAELTEDHFMVERSGRVEGTQKVTINGKETTTGEAAQTVFAKKTVTDLLGMESSDPNVWKVLRYIGRKITNNATEALAELKGEAEESETDTDTE